MENRTGTEARAARLAAIAAALGLPRNPARDRLVASWVLTDHETRTAAAEARGDEPAPAEAARSDARPSEKPDTGTRPPPEGIGGGIPKQGERE